jgi:metallophosphoesterase (TIGR03767 family)
MRPLSRRTFLRLGGAAAAAAAIGPRRFGFDLANAATTGTTLDQTIVKGPQLGAGGTKGKYYRLAAGPGEAHLTRTELATRTAPPTGRRSLVNFVHLTDIHLCDAQSPARVEFLDRYSDPGNGCESLPFNAAFRPQETMSLQVLEAMNRRIREVGVSPVTGVPLAFAMCTGDNVDNEQFNELRWFIDLMDGGRFVTPNSGGPAGYKGVQKASWGDQEYWHPDAGVPDKYKRQYGFPDYPGLLKAAVQPFLASGIGLPWYQTFGNHDGLMQGNAPRDPALNAIAVGRLKVVGAPPGLDPCDSFEILRTNPTALFSGPARIVAADPNRRVVNRAEYIAEHFNTTGTPSGHGFTANNRAKGTAYYTVDAHPGFRMIALDTVNPGGYADGSIGTKQFKWLEKKLREVSSTYKDANGNTVSTGNPDKLVMIFSHHGLRSLNNPLATPDPLDIAGSDLPRVMADDVEALLHRYPNVIAWVDGHTHDNIVEPRKKGNGGFWDIGTAAHCDWNSQSRLIEVLDNGDGTLSIVCTMIDHDAPIVPGGSDPVMNLASIHRELAANDFQLGFNSAGPGTHADRNVELVIRAPFAV